jgi:hypothetical protein
MSRFTGIPGVPTSGLPELQASLFGALKENVELLTSARGESDLISRALIRGDITVKRVGSQVMGSVQQISPDGYTGSHVDANQIASRAAFRALQQDVQALANDLYYTRQALDKLIENLGGR